MKNNIVAIGIGLILFFIPFFWLQPGEMNLGGDAGRLYFYDPLSFLNNYALYNFVASGKGAESGGFVFFPFTFTLYLLKLIFSSPTILIGIFNGIILSSSFVSIYFIIKELLHLEKGKYKVFAAIIGGLFYLFSQELMNAGWENPLITHFQIFLNPLIFLFILKFFLTKNYLYVIAACIVSVIFSANFSFIGAPTFFAFYPVAILFIVCYVRLIRKVQIPYKGVLVGLILFVLLHAFHLIPEVLDIFSAKSANNLTVFNVEGKASRSGLDYFIAVAASTKVSLSWMSLSHFQNAPIYSLFVVFPLIFLGGFYFNKGKAYLLTGIFFLIVLFFATANITYLGFTIYKLFFNIPGFSMFRNFHGQFVYVFIFFYTILLGQAIYIITQNIRSKLVYSFIGIFLITIVVLGFPLINGSVAVPRHKENGIKYTIKMDPLYENVLRYFYDYKIDSKVLLLPLTGPGYQILQGKDKDNTAYVGLSTISYLVGKNDFSGFASLSPYDSLFLRYMKEKNYAGMEKILSIMNIRQIFYNSDSFIYDTKFQGYLYAHVSEYNPKNQQEYKKFVEGFSIEEKTTFGESYTVYTLKSDKILPHIFTTTDFSYTNDQFSFTTYPLLDKTLRSIPVLKLDDTKYNNIIYGQPSFFPSSLKDNSHLHKHDPFVNVPLDNKIYPLVVLKEKFDLYRVRKNSLNYLNYSLLFSTKRIEELDQYGEKMPMYKEWVIPKIWKVYDSGAYNSWETTLARYKNEIEELVDWISSRQDSEINKNVDKIKVNEQLYRHQLSLLQKIKSLNRPVHEKNYITLKINSMFDNLFDKVSAPLYDSSEYSYIMPVYNEDYQLYVHKADSDVSLFNSSVEIDNQLYKSVNTRSESTNSAQFVQYEDYSATKSGDVIVALKIQPNNLVANASRSNSGDITEEEGIQNLTMNNIIDEETNGLMFEVPNIKQSTTYLVSFDYYTGESSFLFSFFDSLKVDNPLLSGKHNKYFEKKLSSPSWKSHQSIVTIQQDSKTAILRFQPFSNKKLENIQIKNLSVVNINYPKLILKSKKQTSTLYSQNPKIVFTKINPTKYKVNVKGVKNPYALVFLETFNPNWTLVDPLSSNTDTYSYVLGYVGGLVQNLLQKPSQDIINQTDSTASYFDGEVQEGKHKNIFFDSSTFETWGKRSVAQNTHSQTFDYANAWIIHPEDMNGRDEYELVIEMDNHKLFYIMGTISFVTLLFVIVYVVRKSILNHEKNNY